MITKLIGGQINWKDSIMLIDAFLAGLGLLWLFYIIIEVKR